MRRWSFPQCYYFQRINQFVSYVEYTRTACWRKVEEEIIEWTHCVGSELHWFACRCTQYLAADFAFKHFRKKSSICLLLCGIWIYIKSFNFLIESSFCLKLNFKMSWCRKTGICLIVVLYFLIITISPKK